MDQHAHIFDQAGDGFAHRGLGQTSCKLVALGTGGARTRSWRVPDWIDCWIARRRRCADVRLARRARTGRRWRVLRTATISTETPAVQRTGVLGVSVVQR